MTTEQKPSRKHLRGFASLSLERRREIASQGGQTAHRMGKAHKFTTEEAKIAGRLGGLAARLKKGTR